MSSRCIRGRLFPSVRLRFQHTLAARPVIQRRGLIVRSFHGPDPEEEEEDQFLPQQHPSFAPRQLFNLGGDEFRIERKLRARSFSIVWLAARTKTPNLTQHDQTSGFIALETFAAIYSTMLPVGMQGEATMRYIQDLEAEQKKGALGARSCDRAIRVHLGSHLCIERELCGPTLAALQEAQPHRSFTLPVAKRIIRQTLLALDFMHTTMKRTHVGVNHHNIHVALLGSSDQITAHVQDYLNSNPPKIVYPSLSARIGLSGGGHATMPKACPLPTLGLSPSLENLEVLLGRCELATLENDLQSKVDAGDDSVSEEPHASFLLSAPEALRGEPRPFSPAVNIWAIGHLLFECLAGAGEVVYTERVLPIGHDFPGGPGPEFPDLAELHSLCSPSVLERRLRSFAHINNSEHMTAEDMQATCAFMAHCFDVDRGTRPTAKQLLGDRWFRS